MSRRSFESSDNHHTSTQVTSAEAFPPPARYLSSLTGISDDQTSQTQAYESTQLCATSSLPSVRARLVSLTDGSIYELSESAPDLFIGRHPSCRVVLQDVNVSGKHLHIYNDGYSFVLGDSSSNGTYVCGSRVNRGESRRLKSGDEISLVQNSFKPSEQAKYVYMFSECCEPSSSISGRYDLGRVIGKGNFSEVLVGIDRLTGQRVAIKAVDTLKTEQFSKKSKSVAIDLESESRLLSSLCHKNILKFLGCFRDQIKNKLYIVTELMDGGDLLNRLLDKGAYPEHQARKLFKEICQGVQYLHSKKIVHRDCKFFYHFQVLIIFR